MSELMESSEFGEWLVGEISRTRRQAKSANPDRAHAASVRLESLNLAKQMLLDFLTLQQQMFDAASEARRRQKLPVPQDAERGLLQLADALSVF